MYARTNTSLPDQLPAFDELRFDPSGGPFPVFGKTSHAADPHGLNAYLMHPEDQLWNYLQPRPRTSADAGSNQQHQQQQQQQLKSDPFVKHLAKSPLGRSSLIVGKPEPIKLPEQQNEQNDPGKRGSLYSKLGFMKPGNKTSRSSTSLSSLVDGPTARGAKSQPVSPTLVHRSVERIEEDEVGEQSVPSPGTVTSATSGLDERTIKGSPVLQREKLVLASEPSPAEQRPMSTSRWSWLGMGQRKKSGSIAFKKPTELHEATPLDPGLSADPLAGVLPSSVSADATPAVNESLHLLTRTRSPMPESLRAMMNLSIRKLSALRAPSPHPILPEAAIPAYLAHHGSDTSESKRLMKFPRSVNSRQLPGMGLGPAEAGMRIDIGVRALLRKIDLNSANLDLTEISSATGLATTTSGKKMPNGLTDLASIKAKVEQNARRGPGIPAFLARPGFEDRMLCYDEDGRALPIQSDRAVYEIEFSQGLEALGEEAMRLTREGRSRQSTYDVGPGRPIQASSRSQSREMLQEDEVKYGRPETVRSSTAPTVSRSVSPVKFPSSQAPPSKSTAAAKTPRKQKPINWAIASDSESSESESEESESEEGQPLSRVATRQKPVEMEPLRTTARPNSLTRPVSLVASQQQQSSRATATSRPPLDRRTTDERRRTEADLTAKYREHVMQTRERRDQARVGVVERQRAGDVLREKERDRRQSIAGAPATTGHGARNVSAPARPNHGRNRSDASRQEALASLTARQHRKSTAEAAKSNAGIPNPGLSRRSTSYADVRASTYQQPFPTSHAGPYMAHQMPYAQPQVMYVPVPVMQYPQPNMGFMPMHPMMHQQQQQQQYQQMPPNFDQMRRKSIGAPILSPNHTGPRHHKNISGHQAAMPSSSRPIKRTPVQ